jgi:hypothetical protein
VQAAEDAEAAKWLGQISVEKEGHDARESEEQQVHQNLLSLAWPGRILGYHFFLNNK